MGENGRFSCDLSQFQRYETRQERGCSPSREGQSFFGNVPERHMADGQKRRGLV